MWNTLLTKGTTLVEVSQGNSIKLTEKQLVPATMEYINNFQLTVKSLVEVRADETNHLALLGHYSKDLEWCFAQFAELYKKSQLSGDQWAIIQAMQNEINFFADENDISSLIFFIEGYLQHSELQELPELSKVLDFTHINVLQACIIHLAQWSVAHSYIRKVIDPIIETIDVQELLETTQNFQWEEYMKTLNVNLLRIIISKYEKQLKGVQKNPDAHDLYDTFYDFIDQVYLIDGPLIEHLEKIRDFDNDLYEELMAKIANYNVVKANIKRSKTSNKKSDTDWKNENWNYNNRNNFDRQEYWAESYHPDPSDYTIMITSDSDRSINLQWSNIASSWKEKIDTITDNISPKEIKNLYQTGIELHDDISFWDKLPSYVQGDWDEWDGDERDNWNERDDVYENEWNDEWDDDEEANNLSF